jgi:hypothetical protein
MKRVLEQALAIVSSLRLSVVLLILLAILTWLGTLEQVHSGLYEVQRRYFDSFFLVHDAWGIPLPLPGARLVMIVLAFNLALGGIVRLRRGWPTAGVLIAHLGIVFLLVAGLVKAWYSVEGHVSLHEGEQANTFESYQRWELALLEKQDDGRVREFTIPEEAFTRANPARSARFTSADLPFELEVTRYLPNCCPRTRWSTRPCPLSTASSSTRDRWSGRTSRTAPEPTSRWLRSRAARAPRACSTASARSPCRRPSAAAAGPSSCAASSTRCLSRWNCASSPSRITRTWRWPRPSPATFT